MSNDYIKIISFHKILLDNNAIKNGEKNRFSPTEELF